jgi:lauroyl/myristoyl acyltransferase
MPPAPLRVRLRTSPGLRRLIPRRLAVARAESIGERRWRGPEDRAEAIRTMETILAATPRAGEAAELARRRLIEEEASAAIFWSPWRRGRLTAPSIEIVERARAGGRPLLISACHLGPYFQQFSALTRIGLSPIVVSGPWFFEDPPPNVWGRRLAHWARGAATAGVRLVPAPGSFDVVRALLEIGEPVGILFDMPGSMRTPFLGKEVELASGTSQLAHQSEALVLPMRARREGTRLWSDILEPLDARAFATPGELHLALAQTHERSILIAPETLENPARPGAWEAGATPEAWQRPNPR